MVKRKHKQITRKEIISRYRTDKLNPKRPVVTLTQDLGRIRTTSKLFLPPNTTSIETVHVREKNPDIISIRFGSVVIKWYLSTEKGFIYDLLGNFSGTYEKHDLKHLFSSIGRLLRLLKK